jgi:hypothetical protein
MQRPKSRRHQRAAAARWRGDRAQAERDAGIPDREPLTDCRDPLVLDLSSHGGPRLRIEPRLGYIACRVIDLDAGSVVACCALKTALHRIADALPRTLSARHC